MNLNFESPPFLLIPMQAQVRALPLAAWLWIQWGAWSRGHPSAVGRVFGLYCVYEDRQYNEHLQVASAAQVGCFVLC